MKTVTDIFEGDEYQDMHFDVVVETVGGSRFTNAGDITALETLYAKGEISAREYIEAYPDDALANKQTILAILDKKQKDAAEKQQLAAQLEAANREVAQLSEYVNGAQQAIDGVDKVLRENQTLKQLLAMLYNESQGKIAAANQIIDASNAEIAAGREKNAELQTDASELAEIIAELIGVDKIMAGGGENAMPKV
jgi:chromosome segregation ATPase